MIYDLRDVRKLNTEGKRVLLRVDCDVPLASDGSIEDDQRLLASIPTIEYLLKNNVTVIMVGHLGRPEGRDEKLSLEPIAKWYEQKFKVPLGPPRGGQSSKFKVGEFDGWKLGEQLSLLENVRFYKEEENNDPAFAQKLANLADFYVNDAFATLHRNHASIVGVSAILAHAAGLQLIKEIGVLSTILEQPKRPLVVVVGGAKIETKLPLIEKMHHFADYVLVGGKIAQETRTLLKVQHEKLHGHKGALLVADLIEDGTDITELSCENFAQIISLSKTIIWNGPLGQIQNSKFKIQNSEESSTERIAKGIIDSGAYSIVGGGDTVGFLKEKGLLEKFSFVSSGGGAMLAFLSGEKLPGLEALVV